MPRAVSSNWPDLSDEELLQAAPERSAAQARRHGRRDAHRSVEARARRRAASISRCTSISRTNGSRPTGRRRWRCRSISRIRGSSGSRRRRCSPSRAASTSGACASCATKPATSSTTPTSCGCAGSAARCSAARAAVSGVLRAASLQQELRAASRSVVRAEPSRRGLRGNVRGVADAGIELEDALRGLAGDQEARIHGRADAVARRQAPAAQPGRGSRSAAPPESHAALSLQQEARALRRRPPDVLRSRSAQAVLRCAGRRRAT